MKITKFFIPLILAVIFFSCSKNEDVITNNGGTGTGGSESFTGAWTVDQVQMMQAPVGSGVSAMMKQALQIYGSVSASSVGYADITFGAVNWVKNNLDHEYFSMQVKGNTIISNNTFALYVSTDGFLNPVLVNLPNPGINIDAVSLVDENTIFLWQEVSSSPSLYKSVNKGANWTLINSNIKDSLAFGKMHFVNNNIGYIIGNNKFFCKTTDGGVTWTVLNYHEKYIDLQFFNENNGVLRGYSTFPENIYYGKCKITTNGGATWSERNALDNQNFRNIFFLDINNAWAVTYDASLKACVLQRTSNGGESWTIVNREIPAEYDAGIVFMNQNEGYISLRSFVLKTVNGGLNFTLQSAPHNVDRIPELINFNGNPIAFYNGGSPNNYSSRPGITDTTKWVLQGKVTNLLYKEITQAPSNEVYATGSYQRDGNTVIFSVANYSGPGADEKIGSGTFSFESGFLNINLQFPNEERWKIKLRKK